MQFNSDVIIYKADRNVMQAGNSIYDVWLLEYKVTNTSYISPLMGWVGSKDTRKQISLKFSTKEQAIEFARKNNLNYTVLSTDDKKNKKKPKSYSSIFTNRKFDS